MQISAESVKFCFYTEYAPKSNMESELNSSFDKKKDKLALGFLKLYCKVYAVTKTKYGYQICFYLLNLQEACHQKFIEKAKRIRSLA